MCNTLTLLETGPLPSGTAPAMTPDEEAFAQRLVAMIDDAGTALMLSIGHRTGLFEAMKKGPVTSAELAERARLHERYVREWLGALTAAGIVTIDPETRRYSLPEAHAALLGRDAEKGNMATMFQFVAVLGGVESRIVDCFRTGGGVPYGGFDRFHEVMAEESAQTVIAGLEEHILPLVPGIQERLEAGIDVVDIGCGSGRAINVLAARYPNSRFTGYDLCEDAVAVGRREAEQKGLANARFEARDVANLDGETFDLALTFDAVHDQAQPATVLANIRRLLRPGGVYLMQDIDAATDVAENVGKPLTPFIYAISCMHCMTVSLSQGGEGLGAAWGEQLALRMLNEAGFSRVETHRLPHDIMNIYYVCRP
ncbi:class I SAM-dependent methyltransferase [Allosphingosinicella vermicomposti]|uniref:class I SAM-dependent methyltransferase n=1 Tax=Allosphingosinicella vermicomposti TaxID=614671 RepID=UPI0018F8764C|nr:class I SAM-dependent methyltransferase [Allosphingosinicella vermicomposti]